jgi:phosphoribosyl 1,2-cyclic phosphodiesterase
MPNVQFSGEPFIVTGTKATISSVIGYVRMFFFGLMFMGDTILSFFGPTGAPDFLKDIVEYLS